MAGVASIFRLPNIYEEDADAYLRRLSFSVLSPDLGRPGLHRKFTGFLTRYNVVHVWICHSICTTTS